MGRSSFFTSGESGQVSPRILLGSRYRLEVATEQPGCWMAAGLHSDGGEHCDTAAVGPLKRAAGAQVPRATESVPCADAA